MGHCESFGDDNIVIKKAYKGSCIVIWGRNDFIAEAESQLKNKLVYQNFIFKQDMRPSY